MKITVTLYNHHAGEKEVTLNAKTYDEFKKEVLCEILDFGIKMGYCDYYHYGFTYTVDKVEEITRRSLRKILTIVQ